MIYAILIYLENGTLLYDSYYSNFDMDSVLISGFTMAINQFGLKIFPDEDLEDIIFSTHHVFFQKFKFQERDLMFLVIHDKHEEHYNLKKINTEVFWEIKQKFAPMLLKEIVDINEFKALDARLDQIFQRYGRKEERI